MADEVVPHTVPKCNVLLVDDDQFIHEMMALFLSKTEFSLVSATNAEDAMKIIVNDAPDIVITDAMMPGQSGFTLIEKMKTSPGSASIPVILWTVLEQDASGKADILMNKPFYRCNITESLEKAKLMILPRNVPKDVTVYLES